MTSFKLSFHDLTAERDRLLEKLPSSNLPNAQRLTQGELIPFLGFARCSFWAISVFVKHRLGKNQPAASRLWEKLASLLNQMLNKIRQQIGDSITDQKDFQQLMHIAQMATARSGPDPFNIVTVKTLCYKGVRTVSSYLVLQHGLPEKIAEKLELCKPDLIDLGDEPGLQKLGFSVDEIKEIHASLEKSVEKGDESIVPISQLEQ